MVTIDIVDYIGQGTLVPKEVTHIRVDSSVTLIESKAFEGRMGLVEVEICPGVEIVGMGAFNGCKSLKRITIPSTVKILRAWAFKDCVGLEEVVLSEGVETIEDGAFFGCASLIRVTIPSSIGAVGSQMFSECAKLVEVEFAEGNKAIGEKAFFKCENLREVTIPASVVLIGGGAFAECKNLAVANLCEGLLEIQRGAFRETALKKITIPSSVKAIGYWSFGGCLDLAKVEMGDGIQLINEGAFVGTKKLTRVTVPSSAIVISNTAFAESGLTAVKLCKGVQEIRRGAFRESSLTQINIPSSMRIVGYWAFGDCFSLLTVEMSKEGPQMILPSAFQNCKALRNVTIPPAWKLEEEKEFFAGTDLKKAFPSEEDSAITETLKQRFEGLPIHQLCYYHPYHPSKETLQNIKETIELEEQENGTGAQQDCVGMTPLHILTCSTKHSLDIYRFMIEKYPKNLIAKDKWGGLPILYAFWGNATRKVVQFLVESYKTHFPDYIFDWEKMIIALSEINATSCILKLFDTHQKNFADQHINWEECAVAVGRSENATIETLHRLLEISFAHSSEEFRKVIDTFVEKFPEDDDEAESEIRLLYSALQ